MNIRALTRAFYPRLEELPAQQRAQASAYVLIMLIYAPFALGGLIWLGVSTQVAALRTFLPQLIYLGTLVTFLHISGGAMLYFVTSDGSVLRQGRVFWPEIAVASMLVMGPAAIWPGLLVMLAYAASLLWRQPGSLRRGRIVAMYLYNLGAGSGLMLCGLAIYDALGGLIPMPGLGWESVWRAGLADLAIAGLSIVFKLPFEYLNYIWPMRGESGQRGDPARREWRRFTLLISGSRFLTMPVVVMAAGLYGQAGPWAYVAFTLMIAAVAWLGNRFSAVMENLRARSRELVELEALGEAIIRGEPDASDLPELLRAHVPDMLLFCDVEIRLFPDQTLLLHPSDWAGPSEALWGWEQERLTTASFKPGETRPWIDAAVGWGSIVTPIIDASQGSGYQQVIGRIYARRQESARSIAELAPTLEALADRIAATLYSAQVFAENVALQRTQQEVLLAGTIQSSFLPSQVPQFEGWELAAALASALETSGDFFDLIPLPEGLLAIVVADVADKGLGAALFMALTRTLLRTYVIDTASTNLQLCIDNPHEILHRVNRRILSDTHNDLFVTAFFGLINTRSGELTYANAGHNPPYIYRADPARLPEALGRTGLPLGMFDDAQWECARAQLHPGDVLLLYSDGLTDALSEKREAFGIARVHRVVKDHHREHAAHIQAALIDAVGVFVGSAPQTDDLTLMVIHRAGG